MWCYGDCLHGDPRLNESPYRQPTFKEYHKNLLLREEQEYDIYPGENYQAELYGTRHWEHDPDVEHVLERAQQAAEENPREPELDPKLRFGVNRFRRDAHAIFVMSTHWRLLAGFTAVNVGMRIPGTVDGNILNN